ncbi:MAG: hypothetical protein ABSG41_21695 [Bryobacteraceae bacterium]|jgi:hypothetical protein
MNRILTSSGFVALRLFSVPAALVLTFPLILAGTDPGEISGTVLEPNGDLASLASLTFIQRTTGVHLALTAGPDGKYHARNLAPGSWSIVARSTRTKAFVRASAELHDGENIALPLTLFDIGTSVEAMEFGGNYLDILRSASEITRGEEGGNIEGYGPYSPRGNFAVNSVGQRSQDNNFMVDGMDNNDAWLRGPVLDPPVDAIASARLAAVYIPADEGHTTGATVDVLTRSGTNLWHGSGFDYLRNSALDSRNFFDGSVKPGATQNQFGGSLGGPLLRRNWCFFLDSDFLRARDGLTVISTVPTDAQKAGNFGATPIYDPSTIAQVGSIQFIRSPFQGNSIPSSRISPPARALIALYPDPNLPGAADNFLFTPSAISNGERFGFRTDKTLSSRNTLFARLNYERFNDLSPSALPSGGSDPTQHADDADIHLTAAGAAVSETFAVSPSLINDVHLDFSRLDWNGVPLTAGALPVVSPEGFAQLGAAESVPSWTHSTSYELKDAVRWTTARHSFTFGAQAIRRYVDGDSTDWTSRSTFLFTPDYTSLPNVANTGDSIASLLLGDPSEIRRDIQFQPYQLRGWELAGFAQDHITIWRKLTIEGGLRYSLDSPVTEANNRMVNFNYDRASPAVNAYGALSYNKLTFAPRVALAWDLSNLSNAGSTVIRAAFSKDYDPGAYSAEGILARNAPYASNLDLFNGSLQLGPGLTTGLPAPSSAAQGTVYAIEPRGYTPYADQWGLYVEHRLRPRLTIELAGTGSMGIHLFPSLRKLQHQSALPCANAL